MLKRLFGRRGDSGSNDTWPFATAAEFARFRTVVEEEIRAAGVTGAVRGDHMVLEGGGILGFTNIAQICAQSPEGEWHGIVGRTIQDVAHPPTPEEPDWETARPLLKARIWPSDAFEGPLAEAIVRRRISAALDAILVIDYPTVVQSVTRAALASWAIPIDEAFTVALANVRADPEPVVDEVVSLPAGGGPDVPVAMISGASHFVASLLLTLEDRVPRVGIGALVAVPNRHVLMVHEIRDAQAIPAIAAIRHVAARMFDVGPGSISPEVYWWHTGALTLIPTTVEKGRLNVEPPDEFIAALRALLEGA